MPLAPDILQALLERAQAVEIGIALATNEQKLLAKHLHLHRQKVQPAFDDIIIFRPETGEVWLVKKATEL